MRTEHADAIKDLLDSEAYFRYRDFAVKVCSSPDEATRYIYTSPTFDDFMKSAGVDFQVLDDPLSTNWSGPPIVWNGSHTDPDSLGVAHYLVFSGKHVVMNRTANKMFVRIHCSLVRELESKLSKNPLSPQ